VKPKISSLAQVEALTPRPPRRIRQTHPLNQIRLVAVEKAAADLMEAVAEALPTQVVAAAVADLMEEVLAAAVKAEVKARRAEAKAAAVAAVAKEVVGEVMAVKVAAAMATAKNTQIPHTQSNIEDDDDGEETDDWPEGIGVTPEDE